MRRQLSEVDTTEIPILCNKVYSEDMSELIKIVEGAFDIIHWVSRTKLDRQVYPKILKRNPKSGLQGN
jgi:hypothetical protein